MILKASIWWQLEMDFVDIPPKLFLLTENHEYKLKVSKIIYNHVNDKYIVKLYITNTYCLMIRNQLISFALNLDEK